MNQKFLVPSDTVVPFITPTWSGKFLVVVRGALPGLEEIKMMENLPPDGQNVASSPLS